MADIDEVARQIDGVLAPPAEPTGMDALAALREADALHQDRRYPDAVVGLSRALYGRSSLNDAGTGSAVPVRRRTPMAMRSPHCAAWWRMRPDAVGARCNLAEALFQLGQVDEAVAEYRQAADGGDPEASAIALGALACIAPGCPSLDHAAIRAIRRGLGGIIGRGIRPAPPRRHRREKLRIGYVSAFFGARNWMKPVWGVINRHDRDRFEIHLLSDGADPSAEQRLCGPSGRPHLADRRSVEPELRGACARPDWTCWST